jgi:hypothetical protein
MKVGTHQHSLVLAVTTAVEADAVGTAQPQADRRSGFDLLHGGIPGEQWIRGRERSTRPAVDLAAKEFSGRL